jgi:hypothetical protein
MRLPLTGSWLDALAVPLSFIPISGRSMDRMVRQLSANGADIPEKSFIAGAGRSGSADFLSSARYVERADDFKQA